MVIARVCVVVQNANRWQCIVQVAPRNRQLLQIVTRGRDGRYLSSWTEWFLWKEDVPAGDSHYRVTAACKDAAPSLATVFRCREASKHRTSENVTHFGHDHAEQAYGRKAIPGLFLVAVHSIIRDDFKMRKLCSQWVTHDLKQQQKQARFDSCLHFMKPIQRNCLHI
jgi:hypothetical protein